MDAFFLFPIAVFAVAIIVIVIVARQNRDRLAALTDGLRAHGFRTEQQPGFFTAALAGTFEGRGAGVRYEKHGKNGTWTTLARVTHAGPAAFRLRVEREGVLAGLAKALGGQDVPTGDDAFDRAFRVRTSDVPRATFVLSEDVRRALEAANLRRALIGDSDAIVEVNGRVYEPDVVSRALRLAHDMAVRLEATRP